MTSRQEPAHVGPDLGDNDLGAEIRDSRDRHDELDCGPKGSKDLLHLRVDRGNSCPESVATPADWWATPNTAETDFVDAMTDAN